MTKEELKRMYDGKKLGEIEAEMKESRGMSVKAEMAFIFALSYLRMTRRYKENLTYKNSSFESYLKGQFNMKFTTFWEKERAFLNYPTESEKYGVGLVAKIHRKCAKKERAVFAEIAKTQQGLKTPIKQGKIEAIIHKNAPPPIPKQPVIDWQAKYEVEALAHTETKKELKAAKSQIAKLKETVVELRPLREMRAAIEPFMIPRA